MAVGMALALSVLQQMDEFVSLVIHRLKNLRQRKLLDRTVAVMDFDLIRLVDLVDYHRPVLSLNLCRQIGIGNLGMHYDSIHIRVAHHHAAFAVHPGRQHYACSFYRIRFAEQRHHRIQAVDPQIHQ
ncbi:hypothetical protein D3C81_1843120 [compost metagenome]